MYLAIVAAIAALTLAVGPAGQRREWRIEVDRSKFRVAIDEKGVVSVVNKALLTGRNMDVRDKMRAAVAKATGCRLVDEMWFDAKLRGKLDCTQQQAGPTE